MNESVPMPSGRTRFDLPDGSFFELDLVEAHQRLNQMAKEHEACTNGEHLPPWAAWVAERTGVTLLPAQAEWLWEYVLIARAKGQADFFSTLKSLSSTDSTPSS